jgi:hypothetical protein
MFLAEGSVTSGDKDVVLLVGPRTPATKTFWMIDWQFLLPKQSLGN